MNAGTGGVSDAQLGLIGFGPASYVDRPGLGILAAAASLHESVEIHSGTLWPVISVVIHLLGRRGRRFVQVAGHDDDVEGSDILSIVLPYDREHLTGREQPFQGVSEVSFIS